MLRTCILILVKNSASTMALARRSNQQKSSGRVFSAAERFAASYRSHLLLSLFHRSIPKRPSSCKQSRPFQVRYLFSHNSSEPAVFRDAPYSAAGYTTERTIVSYRQKYFLNAIAPFKLTLATSGENLRPIRETHVSLLGILHQVLRNFSPLEPAVWAAFLGFTLLALLLIRLGKKQTFLLLLCLEFLEGTHKGVYNALLKSIFASQRRYAMPIKTGGIGRAHV
mgnify:CR=1 FL=1